MERAPRALLSIALQLDSGVRPPHALMHVKIRKFLAGAALLSGGAGFLVIALAVLGASGIPPGWRTSDLVLGALFTTVAGAAGVRLFDDRPWGVPLALLFFGCQIVAFSLPFNTWYQAAAGPYAFAVVGDEGMWAGLGFSIGGAPIPALRHPPSWVGVNLFALAAFWFLWRSPWRASRPAAVSVETTAPVA